MLKKIFLKLRGKGLTNIIPDKLYLKILYKCRVGKKINLKEPITFNEKLQWLKLYDRKDIYTTMVDKYEVKEYVANMIGEDYIIPTLGVYDKFEDIDFDKLPNQFVLKCTHDSGGIIICKDKEKFDVDNAKKIINKHLKNNYYYWGREWPYKNVKPRIIIEPYMEDKKYKELVDYKIMCFNGKAKMEFTCTERFSQGTLKVTFFDLEWNKLPFERKYKASDKKIEKPVNFKKMIELSEKLSKDITFVRIDWYEINGKLYFGEMTFYPGSGCEKFYPEEWDYNVGKLMKLPIE